MMINNFFKKRFYDVNSFQQTVLYVRYVYDGHVLSAIFKSTTNDFAYKNLYNR